jgi:type II secretory pathway component PulK
MTVQEFRTSLAADKPPAGISLALAGLWWDAKGDWRQAHESAQQDEGPAGSWYGRAGKTPSNGPLDEEWRAITESLLKNTG